MVRLHYIGHHLQTLTPKKRIFLNNFPLSVMRHVPDNIFYCKGVFNGNYTANPK